MERADIACSTSMLADVAERNEETSTVLGCSADAAGEHELVKPGSVGRCSQCLVEMMSSVGDSGIAQVEHGSSWKSVAAVMVDVACGSDTPAAVPSLMDVSCGPDATVVDAVDAGCGMKELLHSVLPEDQFDRHTVDLLAFLLALYNVIHYIVCILVDSS